MNSESIQWQYRVRQFVMQLRREFWEHQTLFLAAPAVLALALFVVNLLVVQQLDYEQMQIGLQALSRWFGSGSATVTGQLMSFLALPFLMLFFLLAVFYLAGALYTDRRDSSILFWQSMPVSNLSNVLCKIAMVVFVMPAFMVAVMAVLYTATIIWLSVISSGYELESTSFVSMLLAAYFNLLVMYFYAATSALWLMPVIGWMLLFSAFARRAPLLWALAAYAGLGFIESFVFRSDVLSNWSATRIDPDNFLIIEFGGIMGRLFSYDMLIGLVLGGVLVAGAVYMRRFAD